MQLGARHSLRNGSYSTVRFGRAAHQLHPHQQTFATTIKSSHSGEQETWSDWVSSIALGTAFDGLEISDYVSAPSLFANEERHVQG
jgi:hypothetical protein